MLAPYYVEEIRQLLDSGQLSQRTIARQMGVSRSTVSQIAAGRRHDPVRTVRPWDDEPEQPFEPPRRCPSCGGLVYMPCRLCNMRESIEKRKRDKKFQPGQPTYYVPSGLALKPEHEQRYEEVRRRRKALEMIE